MSKDSENRDLVISELKQELMGPGEYPAMELDCSVPIHFYSKEDTYPVFVQSSNHEEILKLETPSMRYPLGVLFPLFAEEDRPEDDLSEDKDATYGNEDEDPSDSVTDETQVENSEYDEESDEQGEDVFRVNSHRPSSIGISLFGNIEDDSEVVVKVTGARYIRQNVTVEGQPANWWRRVPIEFHAKFSSEQFDHEGPKKLFPITNPEGNHKGLEIEIYSRSLHSEAYVTAKHEKLLTVSLINRTSPDFGVKQERCLFQSRFEVSIIGKQSSNNIYPYPSRDIQEIDEEEQSLSLLYRNRKTFAVGHGCSADWQIDKNVSQAKSVIAEVFPVVEIPNVTSDINGFEGEDLRISMRSLAGLVEGDDGLEQLYELIRRYEKWIGDKEQLVGIEDQLESIAKIHIEKCKLSLESMEDGLEYIKSDKRAMKAFQLANKAVLLQQIAVSGNKRRYQYDNQAKKAFFSESFKAPNVDDIPENRGYWRPFQIAFLLTTIKSVADPKSSKRNVVDLLWFPTGGGKTEAYLGLTAFSIFLRRLRDSTDSGVQVLMRYTLRLLTSQQFQRASALICSMEIIRRELEPELGTRPISIGLWLGGGTTPNSAAEAKDTYSALLKGSRNRRGNSFVVLECPWCHAQIGPSQNSVGKADKLIGIKRMGNDIVIACSDFECPFYQQLPLHVVDEYIYKNQPDLVIATVDKFAQLAWRPEARRLFGIDENGERALSPPSLIIQDELHLISGPLGSMVGIFEVLIDDLCTDKRSQTFVKPKIVSSTATIRRSSQQIRDLYGRDSIIFPHPGTEIEDSFFSSFAEYDKTTGEYIPGKKYVGIHLSNSGSTAFSQVRVYASLIQAPMELESQSRDPWWTIMAFYNSLRELGSSRSILMHEVQNALRPLYNRKNKAPGPLSRRFVKNPIELTGRIPDEKLGTTLDQLSVGLEDTERTPYDVCLASNIIEVGIDIDRLALMLVVGQPKTTSQYIQVTGRVGRQWEQGIPGLIVTLYGIGKPRDKSHFEKFRSYHEQLYAHVEPTSVTPFASPVMDRALAACMIAYIRQNGIQNDPPLPFREDLAKQFKDIFFERVKSIDPDELDNFQTEYNKLINQWKNFGKFEWGRAAGIPGDNDLMASSSTYIKPALTNTIWRIPNTLRSVDAECQAQITRLYVEDEINA